MDLDSERSREEWGNIKVSGKARAECSTTNQYCCLQQPHANKYHSPHAKCTITQQLTTGVIFSDSVFSIILKLV